MLALASTASYGLVPQTLARPYQKTANNAASL